MTIYNFYLFNRDGECLFYREWKRLHNPLGDNIEEDRKLVYGLTFSLQQLAQTLNPHPDEAGEFQMFRTSKTTDANGKEQGYAMHHYETATGLKFVLNTDDECLSMRGILKNIYANIYIRHVVKNPLARPGEVIEAPRFAESLERYITDLPQFK